MLSRKSIGSLISWFFMAAIVLSTMQVTIISLQQDDTSWFSLLLEQMAEEESEDSEFEESVEDAEWLVPLRLSFASVQGYKQDDYLAANPYISFVGEVTSPPPEA